MPTGLLLDDTARRQPASHEQRVRSAPADQTRRLPAAFAHVFRECPSRLRPRLPSGPSSFDSGHLTPSMFSVHPPTARARAPPPPSIAESERVAGPSPLAPDSGPVTLRGVELPCLRTSRARAQNSRMLLDPDAGALSRLASSHPQARSRCQSATPSSRSQSAASKYSRT